LECVAPVPKDVPEQRHELSSELAGWVPDGTYPH
jgi:hypothetical protein